MSLQREAKEQIVQEITEKIQRAKSVYLFEYLGLTVAEITKLRNELKAQGNEMKVYKNRLIKIAAKNAGFKDLDNVLLGPNAIIFSHEDEISGARIVAQNTQDKDFINFKAGIFEGKVIDAKFVEELSQIPSRETLLSQIAAGLLQPLKEIAIGLGMLDATHLKKDEKTLASKAKQDRESKTVSISKEKNKEEK